MARPPLSLICIAFAFSLTLPAALAAPNYDESKVGTFTLPDPLIMESGKPVLTARQWMNLRRPEILNLYREEIYGRSPARPKMTVRVREMDRHSLGGTAVRKQIDLELRGPASPNKVVLHVLLYTPAGAKKPSPTFLCLSFSGNYAVIGDTNVIVYPVWNKKTDTLVMPVTVTRGTSHSWRIADTLARGYGVAVVDYNDIEPDLADGTGWTRGGVRSLYLRPGQPRAPDAWGAISAWAWGASRVMDYLETDPDVDSSHVIMLGQSRLGKTALWAGAQDQRFALVVASCSGEMGASLSRRDFGETVTTMCKSFPYQFCPNFLQWANNIPKMPVDSHMLVSLVAPRPLYLNTGSLDLWSDPRGEFEAAIAAAPVYGLFGEKSVVTDLPARNRAKGSGAVLKSDVLESFTPPPVDTPIMHDIGFQTHTGKHDILPQDWDRFLDFADMHFYGKAPPSSYPPAAVSGTTASASPATSPSPATSGSN
jgi:hypothetical protein